MSSVELLPPIESVETDLSINVNPSHLIERALSVGKELKLLVQANHWAVNLGGTNPHLKIEGAEFIGHVFGVSARVVSGMTIPIQIGQATGWQAEAETYNWRTGGTPTRASAICLSDEDNWSMRQKYEGKGNDRKKATDADGRLIMVPTPSFQLRSMAETRACSKAYRLLFGWIYTLHGFAAQGAEEMSDNPIQQPQQRETLGNRISEKQAKRLWAIARDAGKADPDVEQIITRHGFDSTAAITRDKYEEICAEIQKSDAAE